VNKNVSDCCGLICVECGRVIAFGDAHPASNHPEAPPICGDCMEDEIAEKEWDDE
jgi:hypothetical protein